MNYIVILVVIVLFIMLTCTCAYSQRQEKFNIPISESSAFKWNTTPGYGGGYGTGYSMWGMWPKYLPNEPWKNWMWGRRPDTLYTPYTPVPQIDYNYSGPVSGPVSTLHFTEVEGKLAVDGIPHKTLQLDKQRTYYYSVNTPTKQFMFSFDKQTPIYQPSCYLKGSIVFDSSYPDVLYYCDKHNPSDCGIIYLNDIRANEL